MTAERVSRRKAHRSMLAAIIFYALTIGLGLGGAVLGAYGRTFPALILGQIAFVTAILCFMAFRSSRRWTADAERRWYES
ncbi:hypothetical protein PP640_gp48 [Arthrobacter phage Faja]|uniref:Uncharacterized protein n=1 Tax=Arthrobacter phage Faja TaxID=2419957 RepID=A0A3G2KG19_9CAUD|nr:hypothetical protein PP640_gp48 [Arthrobacter phage Faja]AYN57900.1 hypothetical protein PBI_FAJA_48 [Arthrobacter phage Faja]